MIFFFIRNHLFSEITDTIHTEDSNPTGDNSNPK